MKGLSAMVDAKRILVAGAGNIGQSIGAMLTGSRSYRVTIVDRDDAALARITPSHAADTLCLDLTDEAAVARALEGKFAVLSALPFYLTTGLAKAAAKSGVHYLDLTEDVASTQAVRALAATANCAFIPQCGLAPGFVSIVAHDLAKRFDTLDGLRMRVGALPQYPSNALNYNLTWSTDGVINEYIEPCEAVVDGRRREVSALGDLEEFSLDGVRFEAFNTSGGLGSLCETLDGKVQTLNYKTIRYPGHCFIMKALLNDLGLRNRRDMLREILVNAIPATHQDEVVVFVTATGHRNGVFLQETFARKVHGRTLNGIETSAIQLTTAAGICGALDLLATGALPSKGLILQEEIPLDTFLANRFGAYYADPDLSQILKVA